MSQGFNLVRHGPSHAPAELQALAGDGIRPCSLSVELALEQKEIDSPTGSLGRADSFQLALVLRGVG